MTVTVDIDLNVRVRNGETYTGLEDVDGPVETGQTVRVREPESGLIGAGRITEIDPDAGLVYLTVDWGSLQ